MSEALHMLLARELVKTPLEAPFGLRAERIHQASSTPCFSSLRLRSARQRAVSAMTNCCTSKA